MPKKKRSTRARPPRERPANETEARRKTLAWVRPTFEALFGAWDGAGAVEPALRSFREERQAFELMQAILEAVRAGERFAPESKGNAWASALKILLNALRPHVDEFAPHMKLNRAPDTLLELTVKYAARNLERRVKRAVADRELAYVALLAGYFPNMKQRDDGLGPTPAEVIAATRKAVRAIREQQPKTDRRNRKVQ